MSKKRNSSARRGGKASPRQGAHHQQPGAPDDSVQEARRRAMRKTAEEPGNPGPSEVPPESGRKPQDEVRPGLFPPSRRPPRDPDRKPWETYACMVMAVVIVFLLPDWRDPENPWPAWFRVAPLAFGVLGALFALLDKRRRLAAISAGTGAVLFVGLLLALALLRGR
ncbi:hypothetical protein FCK90_01715 [Kocuria coralli]|uniref:Uncharacterized protein n=1 Tax=Kocuria coralli TaxID=1461025 RepID=A0A5J5L1R9_9MICC|nr:hypothetical protein [Kocuria coralli]KAA9395155.1 hypothetical protein FCK90_01715 [Kocuria coralli]